LDEIGIPLLGIVPYELALIKADMESEAPLDVGGEAVEHIKMLKEKMFRICIANAKNHEISRD